MNKEQLYRVLDANMNRAKEGLRVCEDICRFVLDDAVLTGAFKAIRHQLTEEMRSLALDQMMQARDINGDVGRSTVPTELARRDVQDIFYANTQRVKESIRVLEEFSKLLERALAEKLKRLRYQIYGLEKDVVSKC